MYGTTHYVTSLPTKTPINLRQRDYLIFEFSSYHWFFVPQSMPFPFYVLNIILRQGDGECGVVSDREVRYLCQCQVGKFRKVQVLLNICYGTYKIFLRVICT